MKKWLKILMLATAYVLAACAPKQEASDGLARSFATLREPMILRCLMRMRIIQFFSINTPVSIGGAKMMHA